MKFLSDIRRAVSALAHNQERLYILFCVVLMVTNCCLLITERMNIYARFAYLLIPLAAQMLLLAATKKTGNLLSDTVSQDYTGCVPACTAQAVRQLRNRRRHVFEPCYNKCDRGGRVVGKHCPGNNIHVDNIHPVDMFCGSFGQKNGMAIKKTVQKKGAHNRIRAFISGNSVPGGSKMPPPTDSA